MAYQVYERTPKGSAKSYIDTNTSEVLSARQYRNKTEAAKYGYETLSQKQKAHKAEIVDYPKVGTRHKHYNLGLPINPELAIIRTINDNKSFGFGFFLSVKILMDVDGDEPYERWVSGYVHRKHENEVNDAIKELLSSIIDYDESYQILEWHINIIAQLPKVTYK